MFEPVQAWSLPDHLYAVSGWSAQCKNKKPRSCHTNIIGPYGTQQMDKAVAQEMATGTTSIDLAWTDLTWLLYRDHVSWGYFVQTGQQPDCESDNAETCTPVPRELHHAGHLEPPPPVHRRAGGPPAEKHPTAQ